MGIGGLVDTLGETGLCWRHLSGDRSTNKHLPEERERCGDGDVHGSWRSSLGSSRQLFTDGAGDGVGMQVLACEGGREH